jgi:hypothetical protein
MSNSPLKWKGGSWTVLVEGHEDGQGQNTLHRQVGESYFDTLGISVLSGRKL